MENEAKDYLQFLDRFSLDRADTLLLIVDIQEKLAAVMDDEVRAKVVRNTFRLTEAAKLLSIPAVLTEQCQVHGVRS